MTKLILRKPQEQQFQICSEKSQAAKKSFAGVCGHGSRALMGGEHEGGGQKEGSLEEFCLTRTRKR